MSRGQRGSVRVDGYVYPMMMPIVEHGAFRNRIFSNYRQPVLQSIVNIISLGLIVSGIASTCFIARFCSSVGAPWLNRRRMSNLRIVDTKNVDSERRGQISRRPKALYRSGHEIGAKSSKYASRAWRAHEAGQSLEKARQIIAPTVGLIRIGLSRMR